MQRLIVIRRVKPLGFTLDQMRVLLHATDRCDGGQLTPEEREALLERVRGYEQDAAEQVAKLRVQLVRAEKFARTLRERVEWNQSATVYGRDLAAHSFPVVSDGPVAVSVRRRSATAGAPSVVPSAWR